MLLHVNLFLPLPLELPACVLFTSLCYWTTISNNCKWTASDTNANMPVKVPVEKKCIFWKTKKQKLNTKSHPLPHSTVQFTHLLVLSSIGHTCTLSTLSLCIVLVCVVVHALQNYLPEKSCFQPLFNAWKCFNAGTSTFNVIMIVKTYLVNIFLTFVLFLNHTNICTTVLCGPLCMEDACCLWICMDSLHVLPTVQRRFHGVNCL